MSEMTTVKLDRIANNAPMDARTAAEYLDVGLPGLAKLERDNPDFPTHRLGAGPKAQRRYYRSELDEWLRSRCSKPAPDRGDQ